MKIRFKTWYWGAYCIYNGKAIPEGFEEYSEELHGWQHSEEFKIHGTPEYPRTIYNYRSIACLT